MLLADAVVSTWCKYRYIAALKNTEYTHIFQT